VSDLGRELLWTLPVLICAIVLAAVGEPLGWMFLGMWVGRFL
jgi:hypothetical protein